MTQMAETTESTPVDSIATRARKIWEAAITEAQRQGLEKVTNRYGTGYLLTGNIAKLATPVWPDIDFGRDSKQGRSFLASVYPYMRSCGTVVTLEASRVFGSYENTIFVNETYTDEKILPKQIEGGVRSNAARAALMDPTPRATIKAKKKQNRTSNPSSKVCPVCSREFKSSKARGSHMQIHNADYVPPRDRTLNNGAGRPILSKLVSIGEASSHERTPDGKYKCLEEGCGKVFPHAAGIVGHKKVHYNDRRNALIERLREENTELRRQRSTTVVEQVAVEVASPTTLHDALNIIQRELTAAQENVEVMQVLSEEVRVLREKVAEQAAQPVNTDESALLDIVRETIDKASKGEINPLRALADLDEALSLR